MHENDDTSNDELMIFMNYFWWIILKHCFVNELVEFRNVVKVCSEKKE
jgi:hypothetical protein